MFVTTDNYLQHHGTCKHVYLHVISSDTKDSRLPWLFICNVDAVLGSLDHRFLQIQSIILVLQRYIYSFFKEFKYVCQCAPVRTGRPPTECGNTRCCIIQFELLMIGTQCSKHVEECNKLFTKQEFLHLVGQLLRLH